ncbi:alpha/beta hydrolase [Variovorax terrae]|uniref:Alpha/beta hydrolase n=1 Tax=Variovorax terrae TaxID=2923278 RepID=A0A9X2APH9_9BURK|nr:alpha/beta hydrolase [Variovorax terrae]MCJ0764915.1 alpha/beta hydrolase [Variovorax terrae]
MSLPRIGRYGAGRDLLSFETPPEGVVPEIVSVVAQDGGKSKGVLYRRRSERTLVCILHPRGDMTRHYAIPALVEGGYAVFAQESRWPGNDVAASHELLLADVAAMMVSMRSRGFEKVVLLGYSGGGSIFSFYQSQAVTPIGQRLADTAAGDPFDLNGFNMPPADGIMFIASHLGAGKTMLSEIDPSVTDESDPLSLDPELDMYNPRNGFKEPPALSSYSREFLARYREAQSARVARIDAIARGYIEEQRYFQEIARQPDFEKLPAERRAFVLRRALLGRFMNVYRTDANPAVTDLSIDPSKRTYGSIMSVRPDLSNYTEAGFAKNLTPRAWLSLWSGHASRASVLDNLPRVDVPTLVMDYTGDSAIHPLNAETIYAQSPAADKEIAHVDGDHFGLPLPSAPDQGGREAALRIVVTWLQKRFPS